MARASAMIRGKRSGVVIDSQKVSTDDATGMEDMDAMFDAAASPAAGLAAASNRPTGETESASQSPSSRPKRKNTRTTRKPKTPKPVLMSLPGGKDDNNDDDDDDEESPGAKQYASKYMQHHLMGQSPSELSKVSTAPPTPGKQDDHHELPLTQEEAADVEQVLAHSADEDNLEHERVALGSPEATFPVDNDDNEDHEDHDEEVEEDEGDDLGPPALPDDDFDDDDPEPVVDAESVVEAEPVADAEPETTELEQDEVDADTKPAAKEIASLSDTESDDDDDKEGLAYNMVHDPETPKSVRDERARKEKSVLKKKKADSKKRGSVDTEETTTPPRRTKGKKKKKRTVVFSPTGIPIGNRDYEAVPLADIVDDSPENKALRRSRRAKTQPLAFWKNERLEYGAHDETGELGQAMGHMPVVTHVVKALPTPYKKRKATHANNAGGKKKGRKAASRPADDEEDEPFDSRKLRRKFKIEEGETAHIWDDGADDSSDLSK
jgi:centromere protein C